MNMKELEGTHGTSSVVETGALAHVSEVVQEDQ